METYFALDYTGAPFELLGPAHLAFLALVALGALCLPLLKGKSARFYRRFERIYVAASITNELAYHLWRALTGTWYVQTMLPLHLCSVFVVLNAILLLSHNRRIYEYSYFLGLGGALQALLTPDAGIYGLPHFRAFQTLIAHGLIACAPLYMTTVYGFRPTWRSIPRVFLGANIYMLVIGVVNWALGSNYMFIARKPDTASLIDLLGPWPWYILALEAIGLLMCLVLYLPFALRDLRRRAAAPAA